MHFSKRIGQAVRPAVMSFDCGSFLTQNWIHWNIKCISCWSKSIKVLDENCETCPLPNLSSISKQLLSKQKALHCLVFNVWLFDCLMIHLFAIYDPWQINAARSCIENTKNEMYYRKSIHKVWWWPHYVLNNCIIRFVDLAIEIRRFKWWNSSFSMHLHSMFAAQIAHSIRVHIHMLLIILVNALLRN